MKTIADFFRLLIAIPLVSIVLQKPFVFTEAYGAELTTDTVKAQKLGEYVWGPRISKSDLKGKVIVCITYCGTDRSCGAITNMIAGKIRSRNANMILFMVLVDKEQFPMALRLASTGRINVPIVSMSQSDLKKLLPEVTLEKPSSKGRGRGRRGGKSRRPEGSFATSAVIQTPDGSTVYSGKAERKTIAKVLEAAVKALRSFPVSITNGGNFEKLQSIVKKIASTQKYSSAVKDLERKLESKDSEESTQAQMLIDNIKQYGQSLLQKAEYFEHVHPQTARMTYMLITKQFKRMEIEKVAEKRLKNLTSASKFKKDLTAFKLSEIIRRQCSLLTNPKPDTKPDLTNADFQKVNKKIVPGLLRNIALFKNKYRDSKAAKELTSLLSEYGMSLDL